ncbi:MAG: hypothetical protein WD065_02160 [Planctomycetaceae bacterium]
MDHNSPRSRNKIITASAIVAGGLLMMAFLNGCFEQPPAPVSTMGTDAGENSPDKAGDDCNDIINSFYAMIQPDQLGFYSDTKSAVTLVNEWRDACGRQEDAGTATFDVPPELERLVPDVYLPELATARFLTRDIIHLRDCLMFRKMAFAAIANSDDELGRIVDLFDYVTRNVAALPAMEETIPLSTFETVILGRGTANDRALIYAQLLRQLNIDSVIIRPRDDASEEAGDVEAGDVAAADDETVSEVDEDGEESSDENASVKKTPPFLMGVISGENIYLFDPQWGLPIPSQAEATGETWDIRRPATLADVLADASVLQAVSTDPDNPYPIQTADLENLRVELIGDASFWAPRMQSLQDAMSGDRTLLIYDPVEDHPDHVGMLTRVASVKRAPWKKQDIGLWTHPEQTIRAIESLEENQIYQQNLFIRKFTLNAPLGVLNETNKEGKAGAQFGPPTGGVFKTRIQQVIGNYKEAITSYVTIKLDCRTVQKTPFPEEIKEMEQQMKQMHQLAGDDASYWIALSQMELQDFKAAENSMRSYAGQYRAGRWMMANLSTFSKILARQGKYLGATSILEKAPDFDPQKPSYGYLIQRWKRLAEEK